MHTRKTGHHTRINRHLKDAHIPFAIGIAALAAVVFMGVVPARWHVATALPQALAEAVLSKKTPEIRHMKTPDPVYGIYMTQCAVGTPSFREALVKLVETTKLNAIVIDIKDYTGKISFTTDDPVLTDSVSDECGATDMPRFVETLHDAGVYVIGRITVFQDPYYTKLHPDQSVQSKSRPGQPWKDYKGLSFIDPSAKPYWEYVVALSRYAYENVGFDELNYDYIRWPSDGPMSDVVYPPVNRAQAIEEFFRYLHDELKPTGVVMSADLFGMTTTNVDDLNIGQQLERALPYFDYIDPMVYPSHYPTGFIGLKNPNSDPYQVVYYSLQHAVARTLATTTVVASLAETPIMETVIIPAHDGRATTTEKRPSGMYAKTAYDASKIRPWLQDFDYGKDYLPADIEAQIKATTDNGLRSWLFWDAGNKYTSLRQVLTAASQ